MREIRTVLIPAEKMCHVEFYVRADPLEGMGFAAGPSFVLENKYFETREEAEALKKAHEHDWCEFYIKEKITIEED